jgi:hypothetical protein
MVIKYPSGSCNLGCHVPLSRRSPLRDIVRQRDTKSRQKDRSFPRLCRYVCTDTNTLRLAPAYRPTLLNSLNGSDPDFGVTCMHGPDECAGNVQQLCVAKHTPMRTWWEFVMCQNYHGRSDIGRADVALKCARIHNIDWEESGVGQCVGLDGSGKGKEGVQLLHDSVRVAQSLGITYVSAYLLLPSTSPDATLQQELHRRYQRGEGLYSR